MTDTEETDTEEPAAEETDTEMGEGTKQEASAEAAEQ